MSNPTYYYALFSTKYKNGFRITFGRLTFLFAMRYTTFESDLKGESKTKALTS